MIGFVGCYIYANVLLMAAAALLAGIRGLNGHLPRPFSYRDMLAMGRVLALSAVFVPMLTPWQPASGLSPLRAQVWAAPTMLGGTLPRANDAQIEVGFDSGHALVPAKSVAGWGLLVIAIGALLTLLPLYAEARATIRAVCGAQVVRRIGSVRILVSDTEPVPFAVWFPGHSIIVLPVALLLRPADLRLALRHESQHHRQADTRFLYAALLARALFGINPAVHWLTRQLFELQEFACDEAISRRPGHCAQDYCVCLLRIAEDALDTRRAPLRLFMANWHGCALRRRIEAALRQSVQPIPGFMAAGFSVVAVALLVALSAAIAVPVQDRRLSHVDAEALVTTTPGSSQWGLTVNDAVLQQLNLLLGTPDGRAFLHASIARMNSYKPVVLAQLKRYGLPSELLAVPLVESGYRNLPARGRAGAGLWMFVTPTARRYGLEASAQRDQRLDVAAETRAAMQMFSDLRNRFRDWPLALMAYNSGESRVAAAENATHTQDAWRLYRAGYGNDPDYLARTVAVMLILAHPRLLD